MKLIFMTACLGLLSTACGIKNTHTIEHRLKEIEKPSETIIVEKTKYKSQDFEGFYYCDNQSQLELLADSNNAVELETTSQTIVSLNPNDSSFGTMPLFSFKRVSILNDTQVIPNLKDYTYNVSYSLKEDDSDTILTGKHATSIIFEKIDDRKVNLHIKVYSGQVKSSIGKVIVNRVIGCAL